jgi:hypothetical protein
VGDYSRFLSDPPVRDKRLLELSLGWTGLSGARARMAEFLRVFVITWDPLELDDARPPAFATANSDELCVYVPFWSLEGLAERRGTDVAEVLGWLGGCAVVTAAEYQRDVIAGRHARLVASGEVPDLLAGALEDQSSEAVLGRLAKIEVKGGGWDEIGLGAITDTVQQAYGPVAFDRSLVELAMLPTPRQGCPACAGRRFNFPADLNEQAVYMCGPHQREVQRVTRERLVRAEQSNRPGWNAITDASIRRERPILPFGLASKIRAHTGKPGPELLRLLAQAQEQFSGQPEEFYAAIGEKSVRAGRPPHWMQTLVHDLASAGLIEEALAAAETLADFEPLWSGRWYDDCLTALATAMTTGAIGEDRVRFQVQFVKDLCPGNPSVQMHAGDVYHALDEPESALAAYENARSLAVAQRDLEVRRAVASRITALIGSGNEASAQQVIRVQRRVQARRKRRR